MRHDWHDSRLFSQYAYSGTDFVLSVGDNAVPEPSSVLLVLVVGGVALVVRRRRA